jgi:DNA polymerase
MQKSTIERRAEDPELPPELRELLAIRLESSTTSTSKYNALLRGVHSDNGLRCDEAVLRRGAHRPVGGPRVPTGQPAAPRHAHTEEINEFIEAAKGDYEDLIVGDVMKLASSAIRGCIVAPPGKKLVSAISRTSRAARLRGSRARSGSCRRFATSTRARARISTRWPTAAPFTSTRAT